jgi:hypothetical protein
MDDRLEEQAFDSDMGSEPPNKRMQLADAAALRNNRIVLKLRSHRS